MTLRKREEPPVKQIPEGSELPPGLLDEEDPIPATELTEEGLGRKIGIPLPANLTSMPSREELGGGSIEPIAPNELRVPQPHDLIAVRLSGDDDTGLFLVKSGTEVYRRVSYTIKARWTGRWEFYTRADGQDLWVVAAASQGNRFYYHEVGV